MARFGTLADGSETYRVPETTLVPTIVRVRACRNGLFAGQAAFGRSVSETERIYGFKLALSVSPEGVVTAFGLAPANCDERLIGEFLIVSDGHGVFLADQGFSSVGWERRWLGEYGMLVAATPHHAAILPSLGRLGRIRTAFTKMPTEPGVYLLVCDVVRDKTEGALGEARTGRARTAE